MTSKPPTKAAPRKAARKPEAPVFESPKESEQESQSGPDNHSDPKPLREPAESVSERVGQHVPDDTSRSALAGCASSDSQTRTDQDASTSAADTQREVPGPPLPVPAESAPGAAVESPAPGTVAHEVLAAEIVAQDGPPPVFAGTFAIYEDGGGGYVLVVMHADGTTDRKHIPAAMVKLAQSGFMDKMMGGGGGFLGKLVGSK